MIQIRNRYSSLADPLRSERRVELVLVVVAAIFLLQLAWGMFKYFFPSVPDPVMPSQESLRLAELGAGASTSPEERDEIRRRPLFWVSRAPLGAQSAEAQTEKKPDKEASKKPLKGVKLAGTFGVGDEAGIIVISKGKQRRLMVGQEMDGWTLHSVQPEGATLSQSGKESRLSLKRVEAVANTPAAAESESAEDPEEKPSAKQKKTKSESGSAKPSKPQGLVLGGGDRRNGNKE